MHSGFSTCASWAPECWLNSCGAQAWSSHGTRDLPGPRQNPGPLRWRADLTTEPPAKPRDSSFKVTSTCSAHSEDLKTGESESRTTYLPRVTSSPAREGVFHAVRSLA